MMGSKNALAEVRWFRGVLSVTLACLIGLTPLIDLIPQTARADANEIENSTDATKVLADGTEESAPATFINPSEPEFYERYSSAFLGVLSQFPVKAAQGVVSELLELYTEMAIYRQELLDAYGEARLVEILEASEKDKATDLPLVKTIEGDGLVKGGLTLIDDVPVVKITIKLSPETTVIFVDDPRIKADSFHLSQMIARQLMFANKKKGYDVVIARITKPCAGAACDLQAFTRPVTFKDRVRTYNRGLREPFTEQKLSEKGWTRSLSEQTKKNLYAGAIFGGYQASALLVIDKVLENFFDFDPSQINITNFSVAYTLGYSTFTNLILTPFRRWNNLGEDPLFNWRNFRFKVPQEKLDMVRPSSWQKDGSLWTLAKDLSTRPVRRSTLSLGYRLGLIFWGAHQLNFQLTLESAFSAFNLFSNIAVSNSNTNWWIQPIRRRAELRENKKPFFRPQPGLTRAEIKNKYRMDSAEENIKYNSIWTLAIIDMLGVVTVQFLIPGTDTLATISAWKVGLVGLAALGRWRAVRQAEQRNDVRAPQMRTEFENTFYMKAIRWALDTGPGQTAANIVKIQSPIIQEAILPVTRASSAVKRMCQTVLRTKLGRFSLNYDPPK